MQKKNIGNQNLLSSWRIFLEPHMCLSLQVDCPESTESYVHRVGRTARYQSGGRSVLFLMPSETNMLERLQASKIPVKTIKVGSFMCHLCQVSEILCLIRLVIMLNLVSY